jgi:hypothetical protein
MLGSRSPVSIFASLTAITLSLLTAVSAGAQTPAAAAEKPVAELSASLPKPAPATSDATPVSPTTAKPATESPKAETESVKPETPPATTAATTAAPVMQQCTRTIKADVVAIPQPIMLNRLGATIPNAFVFALKGDTIPDGSNIQLRPGKRPRPLVLRANVGDCLCINICVSNIGEVSLVQHEVITNLIRW